MPKIKPLDAFSFFQEHCRHWADGCGSSICAGRTKVFARGVLPCDVLFIGEAPGRVENAFGQPFVGPAGNLLDWMIERSIGVENQVRAADNQDAIACAFTNVVCCLPLDEEGEKTAEPPEDAIRSCKPRLEELIRIAQPRAIVTLGRVASDCIGHGYLHAPKIDPRIQLVEMVHPAAILRALQAKQGMMTQRCIVQLRLLASSLVTGPAKD